MDNKQKKLFFSGIGGCSMSGLAQLCKQQGFHVSGSDRVESPFTATLQKNDIPYTLTQQAENITADTVDLFVYSAAIKLDHPERAEAIRLGISMMERSELLGEISKEYKNVLCVAGCHGKTTITSMLGAILLRATKNPTIHVGGVVDFLDGGVYIGGHDLFVTEACEYVESYLQLHPTAIILNNIDDDHLDYFHSIDNIIKSFETFVQLLPPHAPLIGFADDSRVEKIMNESDYTIIRYGIKQGDYRATNIHANDHAGISFTVTHHDQPLFDISLCIPGTHNVINALAAIVGAKQYGVNDQSIIDALADYTLTRRRFELYGEVNGAKIYHDYAHHPSEIRACLQGAHMVCKGKLYVVFQCNSYTRAKTLFVDAVNCFRDADQVLVPDIYPGRETDDGTVHATDMVNGIAQTGTPVEYIPTFEGIRDYLHLNLKPNDVVVTLGSGDVYIQTKKLLS